eukprot:TRINITY_DN42785_c0_g1_i1.p1 TRINITY_DN42785_c0_g1~~TRINITY_DN42785_c0_g1_i1.p1  ORF type:complete len:1071 (-),score=180.35 TRINITY_DN42785_c0_g1_i1:275-3487(-)
MTRRSRSLPVLPLGRVTDSRSLPKTSPNRRVSNVSTSPSSNAQLPVCVSPAVRRPPRPPSACIVHGTASTCRIAGTTSVGPSSRGIQRSSCRQPVETNRARRSAKTTERQARRDTDAGCGNADAMEFNEDVQGERGSEDIEADDVEESEEDNKEHSSGSEAIEKEFNGEHLEGHIANGVASAAAQPSPVPPLRRPPGAARASLITGGSALSVSAPSLPPSSPPPRALPANDIGRPVSPQIAVCSVRSLSSPPVTDGTATVSGGSARMPAIGAPPKEVCGEGGTIRRKCKGVKMSKSVAFDSVYGAIRAAQVVGTQVWTVDWRGTIEVRDRAKVGRIMCTVPFEGHLVWCLCSMAPGLVLVGQEGPPSIRVLDAFTKEPLAALCGHSGGVTCLVQERLKPFAINGCSCSAGQRLGRFWSGSNDFTIGFWEVLHAPKRTIDEAKVNGDIRLTPSAARGQDVVIRRIATLHGHSGSVRCILRIGPMLWSGGDDGQLRLWRTSDGSLATNIRNATDGGASVLSLAIVRGHVWACGGDSCVREWTLGSSKAPPRCVRLMRLSAGEECGDMDKCPRSCIPVSGHVWLAGHKPEISIYDSATMTRLAALPAHEKYTSSMLLVDRVETRVIWSTSLGDKKLKVWRHELRGDECADADELQAANMCYMDECASLEQVVKDERTRRESCDAKLLKFQTDLSEKLAIQTAAEDRLKKLLQDEERRREALEAHLSAERSRREESDAMLQVARGRQHELEGEVEDFVQRLSDLETRLQEECRLRGEAEQVLKTEVVSRQKMQAKAESLVARVAGFEKELQKARAKADAEVAGRTKADTARETAEIARATLAAEVAALQNEMNAHLDESSRAHDLCEQMKLRYAELDVFKLDVIARELKKIDSGVEALRRDARDVSELMKKHARHGGEAVRDRAIHQGLRVAQHGCDLRAHIRDVIDRCLSETQKLHIGSGVVDFQAAGDLQNGGVLHGWMDARALGAEREAQPYHGASRAARLRQSDELRRDTLLRDNEADPALQAQRQGAETQPRPSTVSPPPTSRRGSSVGRRQRSLTAGSDIVRATTPRS